MRACSLARYSRRCIPLRRPADLPVEQSTHLSLVVNMKTASALGLKLSNALVQRVDAVID